MTDLALSERAPRASAVRPLRARPRTDGYPLKARAALKLLERLDHGTLEAILPDGQRAVFGHDVGRAAAGARQPIRADLRLASWDVLDATLSRGDVGFAEGWITGDWTASDPLPLLRLLLRNRSALDRMIFGSVIGRLGARLRHLARRNTRAQARRNIQAHYDLGNAFYALWLDGSMTYSSALFAATRDVGAGLASDAAVRADDAALADAQQAKYERVLAALDLSPGSRVLEVGCGWGGFAEAAAGAGHAVTGVTLSPAQLAYANDRLARAGLVADLRLQDYRTIDQRFDAIASIEMFEAVGEAYWPAYFDTLRRALLPGGRACVQTITIDDAYFPRYRRSTDFIQQYIFPGGMLPSPSVFQAAAARAGLRVVDAFHFGDHYARTLAVWRRRFNAQLAAVRALGFDERFVRTWDFYLAYCEAAFAERSTDVVQYTLTHA